MVDTTGGIVMTVLWLAAMACFLLACRGGR